MGSDPSIGKEQWIVMGRRQDCIHERKNICPKQQEAQRENSTRESQLSGCRAFRTTENARIDQTKLLVARIKGRHQEICTRMFQVPTKQSLASEEVRRTTPIGNSTRTMAGD